MTKQILIGGVPVGGGAPVSIQSMTNTRTDDVAATVAQIRRLVAAGCEIVRVAVPDLASARAVGAIKEQISIPLVVDIHFDYRLALEAVAAGADKVRINPGNIGGEDHVKAVAEACRVRGVPIRRWSLPSATSPYYINSILTISASRLSAPVWSRRWQPIG